MTQYHSLTEHSYKSVRMDGGFMNWGTQPRGFKYYPHFYPRFKLDETKEFDSFLLLCGKVNYEKKYGKDSYHLRIQPSAGALYPTELYVQIRNTSGWIDGIYHFEPLEQNLTLLYELNGDGLEAVAGLDFVVDGVLFLVSSPYFRSSWKYKNRSLRYSFLDSGHVYGAIEFSAYAHDIASEAMFDFDKSLLTHFMGFENKELPTLLVICGQRQNRTLKTPQINLPFVSATDYFEQNIMVESAYQATISTQKATQNHQKPLFQLDKLHLKETILSRRSIRAFYKEPIGTDEFEKIMQIVNEPIGSIHDEAIEIYYVVNRVTGLECGIYKDGILQKSGDFQNRAGYLCLEQALGSDSGVTFFITSDTKNYHAAMTLAGIIGHRLYIASNLLGIGASGIGAYYDTETKEFLETQNEILYALAIGR